MLCRLDGLAGVIDYPKKETMPKFRIPFLAVIYIASVPLSAAWGQSRQEQSELPRYSEREFSNDLPAGTVLDGDQPNTFGPCAGVRTLRPERRSRFPFHPPRFVASTEYVG